MYTLFNFYQFAFGCGVLVQLKSDSGKRKEFSFPDKDPSLLQLPVRSTLTAKQQQSGSGETFTFTMSLAFLKWGDNILMEDRILYAQTMRDAVAQGRVNVEMMLFADRTDFFTLVSDGMLSSVFGTSCFYTDAQKIVSEKLKKNLKHYSTADAFLVSQVCIVTLYYAYLRKYSPAKL